MKMPYPKCVYQGEWRSSEEKVGELLEGPVLEETGIPVFDLDVSVDERESSLAPSRMIARDPKAEGRVTSVIVVDERREYQC